MITFKLNGSFDVYVNSPKTSLNGIIGVVSGKSKCRESMVYLLVNCSNLFMGMSFQKYVSLCLCHLYAYLDLDGKSL